MMVVMMMAWIVDVDCRQCAAEGCTVQNQKEEESSTVDCCWVQVERTVVERRDPDEARSRMNCTHRQWMVVSPREFLAGCRVVWVVQ